MILRITWEVEVRINLPEKCKEENKDKLKNGVWFTLEESLKE